MKQAITTIQQKKYIIQHLINYIETKQNKTKYTIKYKSRRTKKKNTIIIIIKHQINYEQDEPKLHHHLQSNQ